MLAGGCGKSCFLYQKRSSRRSPDPKSGSDPNLKRKGRGVFSCTHPEQVQSRLCQADYYDEVFLSPLTASNPP